MFFLGDYNLNCLDYQNNTKVRNFFDILFSQCRSKVGIIGGAKCAAGQKNWCLCGGSLDWLNCLCQFWFYHYVALLFWFFAGQKTENAYMDVK